MSVSSITLDSTYLPTSYLFSFYVLLSCFLFCTHVPLPFRTSTSLAQLCQNKPHSQSGLISHCNFSPKPAIFGGLFAGNPHSSRAVLACIRRPQQHGGHVPWRELPRGRRQRPPVARMLFESVDGTCHFDRSKQQEVLQLTAEEGVHQLPARSERKGARNSSQRLCMLLIPKWSTI